MAKRTKTAAEQIREIAEQVLNRMDSKGETIETAFSFRAMPSKPLKRSPGTARTDGHSLRLSKISAENNADIDRSGKKDGAMNPTTYSVRFRLRSTGKICEREFWSMLARTIFVIEFEYNGFGTVLDEWTS